METSDDKSSYKYSFRLNREQNTRFNVLLRSAGCEDRISRFIVGRLFGEEFRVVKTDPSMARYIAQLNNFYNQFQRIGNNYNQIVKAVNAHYSTTAIPAQIRQLEQHTRELKALSEQIIHLSERFYKQWSQI